MGGRERAGDVPTLHPTAVSRDLEKFGVLEGEWVMVRSAVAYLEI